MPTGETECLSCLARHPIEPLPWDRSQGWWPRRFLATWWRVAWSPRQTFERFELRGSVWRPLVFAIVCSLLRYVPVHLHTAFGIVREVAFVVGDGGPLGAVLKPGGMLLLTLLGIPVLVAVNRMLVLGTLDFGLLWLTRSTRRGLGASVRASGYATAPLVFAGIPGLWIPMEFLQLGLRWAASRRLHELRGWRLGWLGVVLALTFILYLGNDFANATIQGALEGMERSLFLRR